MGKKSKFYKIAFWVILIVVIVLAISLARLMYDYAKEEENLTAVDLEELNLTIPTATQPELSDDTIMVELDENTTDLKIIMIQEGELLSFPNLEVEDPDGDEITFTFSTPLNDEGEWQTKEGDAGNYQISITATDGELSITEKILVIVEPLNRAPVIEIDSIIRVKEGELITLEPAITDPEGDNITITYSGWMNSSIKQTGYDDSGEYEVTITASDGSKETSTTIAIIVENVNRSPVFVSVI